MNGNLNLSRAVGDLKYKLDESLGPHQQIISGCPDVKGSSHLHKIIICLQIIHI